VPVLCAVWHMTQPDHEASANARANSIRAIVGGGGTYTLTKTTQKCSISCGVYAL
jgi:hypothetical protein